MQPHLVLLHSVGWLKKNKEVNLSGCCWPASWFRPDPASCETAPSASDKLACGCKRRNQFFFRCFVWKQKEVFTVVYGGWQGKGPSHLLSWPRPTATQSLNSGQELCVFKSGRKWLATSLPTPPPPEGEKLSGAAVGNVSGTVRQSSSRCVWSRPRPPWSKSHMLSHYLGAAAVLFAHLALPSRTFQSLAEAGCWHIFKSCLIINICCFFCFFTYTFHSTAGVLRLSWLLQENFLRGKYYSLWEKSSH